MVTIFGMIYGALTQVKGFGSTIYWFFIRIFTSSLSIKGNDLRKILRFALSPLKSNPLVESHNFQKHSAVLLCSPQCYSWNIGADGALLLPVNREILKWLSINVLERQGTRILTAGTQQVNLYERDDGEYLEETDMPGTNHFDIGFNSMNF